MARKPELSVIGRSQPRLDGAEKLCGRAEFTDDVSLPGMLHCKIVRSPLARGRILNIDVSRAAALPGVKAVITHEDAAGMLIGMHQPLFCKDQVNYVGDEVAAVAAVDEDIAAEAAALIRVDYEPLPEILDLEKAMAENAPQLKTRTKAKGNIAWEKAEDYGHPDEMFGLSDHIRTDEYVSNPSHNCYAEFHACVADWRGDKLTVWTPTQTALLYQKALAAGFGLSDGQVRIMSLNSGGGFTGRSASRPHHFITALLSRKVGRPVKFRTSGDEEFIVCRAGGRNIYRFRSGVTSDGKLKVVETDLLFDCGAHIESQMIILILTSSYLHLLYDLDATRYRGRLIYTNNMPYYFHHGGGLAQMQFGWGQHLDALARDLGMDPVDFHLRNAVDKGYTSMSGAHFASCGLKQCIRKAASRAQWKKKYRRRTLYKGIGIGIGAMASGAKGVFKHDTSAAFVKIAEDGSLSLFTGLPDMGQSSHTAMAIIAAEVLGVAPTDINVISGDTDIAPLDVGAFSQRGTFTTGNAVKSACADARKQLARTAAAKLDVKPQQLVFRDHQVYAKSDPESALPFKQVVYETLHSQEGRFVMGRGFYNSPKAKGTMAYSFGAQIAEVSVDPDTGIVTVEKVIAAHDIGRAINPRIVEGQIDGQVFSGMSQVLFEECVMEEGQIMNPSRLDYKMPRAYEMPEVEHILVETIDPFGPFGAKEVGEGPIVCTMQAIANAVANAIGQPIHEMPITPWRVLRALSRSKPAA
jgi:4-hydroxybenzoyl-CoA reductase subunit alpha